MDLSQLTNGFQPVTVGGKSFTVRMLKLHEWGDIQSWLKHAVPSPIAEAASALQALKASGEKLDPEVRQAILDHAQDAARLWPPRVGSIPWIRSLSDIAGGTARFIQVALGAAGHAVTEDEALELDKQASVDEVADLIRVCLHGEKPLPKAMAPGKAGLEATGTKSRQTTGESCSMVSSAKPDGLTGRSAN